MPRTIVIFTLLLAFAMISSAPAEEKTIRKKDAPAAVLSAFKTAYPKATIGKVAQETEDSVLYYEISCKDGKVARDVTYTADGNVISVETTIAESELPLYVRATIVAAYPIHKIWKVETILEGGVTSYEVLLQSEKRYYEVALSAEGKITETEDKGEKLDDDD